MTRDAVHILAGLAAAAGALLLVTGARSSCSPAPLACEPHCVEPEVATGPLCGRDGFTYETFCDLKCAIGGFDCDTVGACPDLFYEGACLDVCVVREPAPTDVGAPLPAFLCRDRNDRSATAGAAYSDIVLAEQVWIAYFGSCT